MIPSGYIFYGSADFQARFSLPSERAQVLASDYLSILGVQDANEFSALVVEAKRDLQSIAVAAELRYGLKPPTVGRLALFLANLASARSQQRRQLDLGITKCIWLVSSCGRASGDPNAGHLLFSGQEFDPSIGMRTEGQYILPGVSVGCTCVSKSVIPGF